MKFSMQNYEKYINMCTNDSPITGMNFSEIGACERPLASLLSHQDPLLKVYRNGQIIHL